MLLERDVYFAFSDILFGSEVYSSETGKAFSHMYQLIKPGHLFHS